MKKSTFRLLFVFISILWILSCQKSTKWAGQKPIQVVPTDSRPVQKQWKGTFELGGGIYASNDFEGARLNGIVRNNDTLVTVLITSENTPINPSPWYAFKLWSLEEKEINLRLTYQDGSFHRYYPKLSYNGKDWTPMDSLHYLESEERIQVASRSLPKFIRMQLSVGPDTLWVAAQELITSSKVHDWIERIGVLPYVSKSEIGRSVEGRPIELVRVGESDDKKMIFVLSRQHPPEVTGYLAMEAFVETIASDDSIAETFRKNYNTYIVPLANPDGVDNGHWRHSTGGIDLNRDWANVNQPEVAAIQGFMEEKIINSGGTFFFGVDFHSTWEDIYYTIDTTLQGNRPGLVPKMISGMAQELGLDPNIRPNKMDVPSINSSRYFFEKFGAEALTYEIGDDTPRELLRKKGEFSARELMKLLLAEE
ncbi:MAG: hypothetical protein RLZZ248_1396 [Bacteroidota bacterium]